jgi:CheY-like chemotaxis protein
MKKTHILWIDDEIDLLKPHIIFLEQKGYQVSSASNGIDAIQMVKEEDYNIIFLDENMPGLSGLETLEKIKSISPGIPIIMITKSEAENIMDEAIGSKINDYLIKPVNPNQILLSIKKNIDNKRLVTQKTTTAYQSQFSTIGMKINEGTSHEDWIDIYKKLVYWEIELAISDDDTMDEVFKMQQSEANSGFSKFIKRNYHTWFDSKTDDKPLLSPNLLPEKVFPYLKQDEKVFLLLIDNLRYDQWKIIRPLLAEFYKVESEDLYYSILPTATQYSRNALFSGLMPFEIDRLYPDLWKNDDEPGGKNLYEEEMLKNLMQRHNVLKKGLHFEKVTDINYTKKISDNLSRNLKDDFNVVIVNFVDTLSHAKTESKMIKDLANTETAYRDITKSWLLHSPLYDLLKSLSKKKVRLIISTDHGSIRVKDPVKVVGDKHTTTNLRYKQGRNLSYNDKEVFSITSPADVYLPKTNISSTYIFATGDDFFAYPNNYNHYVKYYKDTFQHGGISMQEMLIPIINLSPL